MYSEKVTLFRPEELCREDTRVPAQIYNHCRLLLGPGAAGCRFVPIRSMQFQGVITREEVVFVDAFGYRVQDGEGGRVIVTAWQFGQRRRQDLDRPVPVQVIHYHADSAGRFGQLLVEFGKAAQLLLRRRRASTGSNSPLKVVPLAG